MDVFVGQTRSRKLVAELAALGLGEMTQPDEYPPRRTPWALDNAAFKAWRAGRPFDQTTFEFAVWRSTLSARRVPPAFVVVPDVVADAPATIAMAGVWIPRLREVWDVAAPLAFVVQDGMTEAEVLPVMPSVDVVFVGGSRAWKWATAARWCALAHAHGKRAHIGRVGTPRLVAQARVAGADSIDSALPLRSRPQFEAFVRAIREAP